jgi:hypothetical protein
MSHNIGASGVRRIDAARLRSRVSVHGLPLARLVGILALVMLAVPAVATPNAGRAPDSKHELANYLSSMHWNVRAAATRGRWVREFVQAWIEAGDGAILGEIAGSCRTLRAFDASRRFARITPPLRLRASHTRLSHSYSVVRTGCSSVRTTALATRTAAFNWSSAVSGSDKQRWLRATREARHRFKEFLPALRSLERAVTAWRAAALEYAETLKAPTPAWLRALQS